MKKTIYILLLTFILPFETVKNLDIEKFMGKWYVIAAIPSFVEKGCINAYDIYTLNENGTIAIKMTFNIFSGDCNDNSDCTNLTLTLKKGTMTVATQEFPEMNNDGNDQTINWNVQVDRNMTRWNKSGNEKPVIQIEYSKPVYQDITCAFLDCSGDFTIYYSNQNDTAVEVSFPVMNNTMPIIDEEEGSLGAVSDALPGFGLMAGMAALAMAAVAGSRIKKEE